MDLKTLEKMTVIKLREEALKIPGLTGVRGMSKEELVREVAAAHNLDLAGRKKGGGGKSDLKKQIREFRAAVSAAVKSGKSSDVKKLRRHIKRLKRQTRHLAAAGSEPSAEKLPAEAPGSAS